MGCPTKVELGKNVVFSVTTHDPDTGVLTDADAVPPWRLYEEETATPITSGNMAKLDDANTTGLYSELVACTTGNGFEHGKTYTVYIEATVDSDKGGMSYAFTTERPVASGASLAAVATSVGAIPTTAMRGTDSAATAASLTAVDANVDTLVSRVTAAVATAASLTTVDANVDTLVSRVTAAVATAASMTTVDANVDTLVSRVTAAVATSTALATAQSDLDKLTGTDGATLATAQGNYAPAKAGDLMGLANDAITSAKYDESTAFPVKSDDSGSTQIARTGADADTLETLSDQVDGAALEATLTAIKGAGWTDENLTTIDGLLDALTTAVAALPDAAAINAEVVDALATDTYAEPGQGAPAATNTLAAKIGYLFKAFRNKIVQDATTLEIYNDAGAVVDQKATISDDGTDYTRGEIGTGP